MDPVTLEKLREAIDAAIPVDWTRVFPTDKKIEIIFSIDLPDEHRSIHLKIKNIHARSGQGVTLNMEPCE